MAARRPPVAAAPGPVPRMAPRGGARLRLARPVRHAFAATGQPQPTATELQFLTESLAAYDLAPDLGAYARGGGHSFARMCDALLDGLDRALPALDAALLAYHLPDPKVTEVAGAYLAHRCPGDPVVFSVAGQGVGAPFTALRVLDCMRRAGRLGNGAVFVLDQSTVAYRDPDAPDGSAGDCAVLLHTEPAGGGAVLDFLDEQPATDPNDLLARTAQRYPGARIIAGRMLADRLDPNVRARYGIAAAVPPHLCTSAWALLAEHWTAGRYTLVADYDPYAGRLFQAGLRA